MKDTIKYRKIRWAERVLRRGLFCFILFAFNYLVHLSLVKMAGVEPPTWALWMIGAIALGIGVWMGPTVQYVAENVFEMVEDDFGEEGSYSIKNMPPFYQKVTYCLGIVLLYTMAQAFAMAIFAPSWEHFVIPLPALDKNLPVYLPVMLTNSLIVFQLYLKYIIVIEEPQDGWSS